MAWDNVRWWPALDRRRGAAIVMASESESRPLVLPLPPPPSAPSGTGNNVYLEMRGN